MKTSKYNYIIVAGCSRLGANIASMLSGQGKDVVVVDINSSAFRKLSPDYSGFTNQGDASDIDTLSQANIGKADVVVAATNDDNTNIMIAQIARKIFNVPKVISRLYDTEKETIYQDFDIQVIHPVKLSVSAFEQLLSQDGQGVLR